MQFFSSTRLLFDTFYNSNDFILDIIFLWAYIWVLSFLQSYHSDFAAFVLRSTAFLQSEGLCIIVSVNVIYQLNQHFCGIRIIGFSMKQVLGQVLYSCAQLTHLGNIRIRLENAPFTCFACLYENSLHIQGSVSKKCALCIRKALSLLRGIAHHWSRLWLDFFWLLLNWFAVGWRQLEMNQVADELAGRATSVRWAFER